MPKQRLTCTRCSQRRQKCDRKSPCSRCIQNQEAHLCTTHWANGYNPTVHRRYPRKLLTPEQSATESSDTASTLNASPSGRRTDARTTVSRTATPSSRATLSNPIVGDGFSVGHTKFLDITIGTLLDGKDAAAQSSRLFDHSLKYVRTAGKQIDELNRSVSFCSLAAQAIEKDHIQSLLPTKENALLLVDYYYENMLYWLGGLYHGPSFREKLVAAYGSSSTLDLESLDWRWTALLFAILSSCIIASPEALSVSWGYSIDQKVCLSKYWGAASLTCLNLGNYLSQYHICSVQAIYVLHAYEHLTGSSNQWVALRSVALVIAKGLGLHRLGPHPDDHKITELNTDRKQAFIDREIGRRLWFTMTAQEWLCSTSRITYCATIEKRQFTTSLPMNLDEETMLPITDNRPSFALVCRYLYKYAELLHESHNEIMAALDQDDATRYALILKYDGEFRTKCTKEIPEALYLRKPFDPSWPKWAKWARTLYQASFHHKITMLHQSFLNKSLKDVRYTYSRWACTTAAKNVIELYTTREAEEPQWWVELAFVVTAGICLMLDVFHRPNTDAEVIEYQNYVQQGIHYLQQFFTSSVALHGVRLLLSLLQEYNKMHGGAEPTTIPARCNATTMADAPAMEASFGTQSNGLSSSREVPLSNDETTQFNFDIDTLTFEDLMDYLPTDAAGLDNNVFYDTLYGSAPPTFS